MAALDSFASFVDFIMTPSPILFVAGFMIIMFVPMLLHFVLVARTETDLPTVLLAGPAQSGKTSFSNLLEFGQVPRQPYITYMAQSVELEASTDVELKDAFRQEVVKRSDGSGSHYKKFLVVDTPGMVKMRNTAFTRIDPPGKSEGRVKAVVYFVDAAALGSDDEGAVLSNTSEYLYDMLLALQKKSIRRSKAGARGEGLGIPVLVAANKMDLFTALPGLAVKTSLEAELTRIRDSKSRGLLDSGVGTDEVGSEERDDWLGEYGSKKFSFAQMAEFGIDVGVIGGNLRGENGPEVEKWWRWLAYRI